MENVWWVLGPCRQPELPEGAARGTTWAAVRWASLLPSPSSFHSADEPTGKGGWEMCVEMSFQESTPRAGCEIQEANDQHEH